MSKKVVKLSDEQKKKQQRRKGFFKRADALFVRLAASMPPYTSANLMRLKACVHREPVGGYLVSFAETYGMFNRSAAENYNAACYLVTAAEWFHRGHAKVGMQHLASAESHLEAHETEVARRAARDKRKSATAFVDWMNERQGASPDYFTDLETEDDTQASFPFFPFELCGHCGSALDNDKTCPDCRALKEAMDRDSIH